MDDPSLAGPERPSRESRGSPEAPIYIVMPPGETAVGGAEKRLVGLWLHLARAGRANVRLVANEALVSFLKTIDEFGDLPRFSGQIDVIRGSGQVAAEELHRFTRRARAADRRAVMHFVAFVPRAWSPIYRQPTLFTLACASLTNFNLRGLLDVLLATARSDRTDVLDQGVADDLRKILPFRGRAISVTPGSFVDVDFFQPLPAREKKNRFVFLGTFIRNKQVFRLLERLPAIYEGLRERGFSNVEFEFLGRDSVGEPSATEIIERLSKTIPVRAYYAARPSDALRESKGYFALQRLENYPSKALLEAMACGALPIVTDVGKSRLIAREDFAEFVPGPFSAEDVTAAAAKILALSDEAFDRKVGAARGFIAERFSARAMSDYYLGLYRALAQENSAQEKVS